MDSRDSLLYRLIEDILTNFIEHTSPRERQLATDEIMTTIRLWMDKREWVNPDLEELGRRVQATYRHINTDYDVWERCGYSDCLEIGWYADTRTDARRCGKHLHAK